MAERAKDFPQKPVYMLGTGESVEMPVVSETRTFGVADPTAFAEVGITHNDVAQLMIYDALAAAVRISDGITSWGPEADNSAVNYRFCQRFIDRGNIVTKSY